jgi:hypothetical protein
MLNISCAGTVVEELLTLTLNPRHSPILIPRQTDCFEGGGRSGWISGYVEDKKVGQTTRKSDLPKKYAKH